MQYLITITVDIAASADPAGFGSELTTAVTNAAGDVDGCLDVAVAELLTVPDPETP